MAILNLVATAVLIGHVTSAIGLKIGNSETTTRRPRPNYPGIPEHMCGKVKEGLLGDKKHVTQPGHGLNIAGLFGI